MMALSRRSFLKRIGGALVAVGIGVPAAAQTAEETPLAALEELDGFSQTIPIHTHNYTPGLVYVNEDDSWRVADGNDVLKPLGIAVSSDTILIQGVTNVHVTADSKRLYL